MAAIRHVNCVAKVHLILVKEDTVKLVQNGHSQKDQKWFSTLIKAYCRTKVLQKAPNRAFCITFDLHKATIYHKDLCFVYF